MSYTIQFNLFYLCQVLERISRTSRWVTSPGLTLHSTLLIHPVRVCVFASLPFLHVRKFVLKDEDTYFASSFRSLTDNYMPHSTKKKGDNAMHSDSSTKHKKWLLAVSDATGLPTLFTVLEMCSCLCSFHRKLHKYQCIYTIYRGWSNPCIYCIYLYMHWYLYLYIWYIWYISMQ